MSEIEEPHVAEEKEREEVKELLDLFKVEEESVKEIEVPSRILDLIYSFVDSSTNLEYYFNKPPFLKLLDDGSYWQYAKFDCEMLRCSCVRFVTWKHDFKICDEIKILIYERYEKVYEFDALPQTLFSVVFRSHKRQRKINLFDVYRKLLFYINLENYYYRRGELEEQQQNS